MRLKFTPLQIIVHLSAWSLAGWLIWGFITNQLTVNPIQALMQRTGNYALIFLVLSLTCTPLNTVFGFRQALKVRRALGLYAFLFAASHFLILIGLDYGFDWMLLQLEILNKRYILVGLAAGAILLALAITSFKWWMKRLGKNWKRLHKLVYLAGPLVILHFAWARKGDFFSLQGDMLQPFLYGLFVVAVLALRLPVVRQKISQVRFAFRQPKRIRQQQDNETSTIR